MLNNRDISDKWTITLRNKVDALQKISETPTPNDEYENIVTAYMEAAAAEWIPTKLTAKYRVPLETLAVKKKESTWKPHLYTIKGIQQMPTLRNLRRHSVNQIKVYPKEQTEYIQDHINKIRHSVEERQFRIARQTGNEESKRKVNTSAKLKAARQKERIHLWKEHFARKIT